MLTIFPVFLIAIFHCTRVQCLMIWDKNRQNFVDVSSVPQFASFREQVSGSKHKRQDSNARDISGKVLKTAYYEAEDIVMFYENDTKMTGICGEIWNLLADHLNFTLIPVKYNERKFGEHLENGSYSGLLGMLNRNETDVILRTGYYPIRMNMLEYTMPLWRTRFQLYMKPEYKYDNKWIITMFSPQSWFVLIFLFIILSLSGYIFQKEYRQQFKRKKKLWAREYFSFNDHLFYTYSIMCNQGYIPNSFYNQNKILCFSKSIFAWLIMLMFSSNLIYRMTNPNVTPPFTNFHTLLNSTKYDVLAFKGSTMFEILKWNIQQLSKNYEHRIRFVNEPTVMHHKFCKSENRYVMLENQDIVYARNKRSCPLMPVGDGYFPTWIGFAVRKHLPYKKAINLSILKLYEVGIIDNLKDRWLDYRMSNTETIPFKTIDMNQVYFIFCIPVIGAVLSLILLSFEKIMFSYKNTRTQ